MSANGMNQSRSPDGVVLAGVSKGDLVWLHAVRNSPVSQSPLYQRLKAKAEAMGDGRGIDIG